MNKIIFFLTPIFLVVNGYSQKNDHIHFDVKATYDVTFLGDSTDTELVFEESCYLFVNDTLSLTESVESFRAEEDTVLRKERKKIPMERVEKGVARLTWAVWKSAAQMTTYDSFSPVIEETENLYYYSENATPISWNLLSDRDTINGIYCQKALGEFGGRQWEAWFAPDIPIHDGPYKFAGLPGLIVEVYDTRKHWQFKLTDIEKSTDGYIIPIDVFSMYAAVDKKEAYFKRKRYYQKNYIEIKEASGIDYIDTENREIMRKNSEIGFKQHSNWIELYPLSF